jgi:hypothetical protein
VLASLVERGVVVQVGEGSNARYAARGHQTRRAPAGVGLAGARPGDAGPPPHGAPPLGRGRRVRHLLLGRRGRFAIGTAPVVAGFLAAEWMVLSGSGSFAGVLNFAGVVVIAMLAGAFPVLLLIASRAKGEHVPAAVYRVLGNRELLGVIYLGFAASVLLYGLVIWHDPLRRAAALVAGAATVAMAATLTRRGAFAPSEHRAARRPRRGGRVRRHGGGADRQ